MSNRRVMAGSLTKSKPTLLTGLMEWWENANSIGRHSGTPVDIEESQALGPNGLLAWACTTPGLNLQGQLTLQPNNATDNATVAWVGMLNSSCNEEACIAAMGGGTGGSMGITWTDVGDIPRIANGYASGSYVNNRLPFGVWSSVVVVIINRTYHPYINGVPVSPLYDGFNAIATITLNRIMGYGATGGKHDAIFAAANRAWTQEDVDAFHNGGTFRRYDDL